MAATIVGRQPTSRAALATTASRDVSSAVGSSAPSSDTAVRSTAIGLALSRGASARSASTDPGRPRPAATRAAKAALSAESGQSPCQSSQVTSQNVASSTKSRMS